MTDLVEYAPLRVTPLGAWLRTTRRLLAYGGLGGISLGVATSSVLAALLVEDDFSVGAFVYFSVFGVFFGACIGLAFAVVGVVTAGFIAARGTGVQVETARKVTVIPTMVLAFVVACLVPPDWRWVFDLIPVIGAGTYLGAAWCLAPVIRGPRGDHAGRWALAAALAPAVVTVAGLLAMAAAA